MLNQKGKNLTTAAVSGQKKDYTGGKIKLLGEESSFYLEKN